MPVFFSEKIRILFFLCLFLFVSCQKTAENDVEAFKKDPQATAEFNRINQSIAQGQYLSQNDIDSLSKIREKYPKNSNIRLLMQSALIKREDWQTAADFISQIPESERSEDEKKNLARIYSKLGRYEEALKTVTPLLEKSPANIDFISISSNSMMNLGRYEESAVALDKVWNEIVNQKRFEEMTMRGMLFFYQKNYDKAIETLNKSIEINPNNVAAYNSIARVYAAQGNTAKAEEYTKKVQEVFDKMTADTQKNAKFVDAAKKLQEAFQNKRYEEVIDLAQKLLPEAEGENKYALYQFLANSYMALGKTQEAKNAVAEAEKVKSKK
ncbi:MAG TPA: tetratricopeptide repeat protein [Pyrinomonadaceae bacterium]|nr:tetratricopeptide repeat protein [Pyrinomonadaceae bacterium]